MAEKKNQHFVPQSYLRFFSNNEKTIGTYSINKDFPFTNAPIKGQASEDYIYSKDIRIEGQLEEMEKVCMRIFRKIITNPDYVLHDVEKLDVIGYLVLQFGRTRLSIDRMKESINESINDWGIQKFKEFVGHNNIIDPHLRFACKKEHEGAFTLGMYNESITLCYDLTIKCLVISPLLNKYFITSDNPVCLLNPLFDLYGIPNVINFNQKGLCLLMTLTPSVAILLYDSESYKIGARKPCLALSNSKDIDTINRIVASNSNEVLYFNDKHCIDFSIREKARSGKLKKYESTYRNGACVLPFIHILDIVKYQGDSSNLTSQFLYRKFCYYLMEHPDVAQKLKTMAGSASNEDKKKIRDSLRNRT